MSRPVRIGVLRLVDSAPVMVAAERGLFAACGLDAIVQVEPSWSNIADKLTYGLLDAAVMLPPLAFAATMGLRGPAARLVVPMSLTQGGNMVVLNNDAATGVASSGGLLAWLSGQSDRPRFAVVHTFSTHNLLLRYWLAASGVDPDRDIETLVIPPEDMVKALGAGQIAGFCAGAPWGDVAAACGAGQVLLGTSAIWPHHPEKCLAVGAGWAETNPDALVLLTRALLQAQILCDRADTAPEIATLLAQPDGLDLPEVATLAALPGRNSAEQICFHARSAWFPAQAHALWFLGQMRRWGWVGDDADLPEVARTVYRPDLLGPALAAEGILSPQGLPALEEEVWLPSEPTSGP
ncbi:MAG: CmpA/NrtA family ABC transporter substrate-binding protein [Acetobacteraceae bacterium]|nr:CmpA/NrtA family ABC transporter substrate-binding protein [Acetobacteraceae bacterium]